MFRGSIIGEKGTANTNSESSEGVKKWGQEKQNFVPRSTKFGGSTSGGKGTSNTDYETSEGVKKGKKKRTLSFKVVSLEGALMRERGRLIQILKVVKV